jgi:hypothetical protein
MSDEQKYTIQGLDEYIRQGEPQQKKPKSKVQKLHFRRGGGVSHHAYRVMFKK